MPSNVLPIGLEVPPGPNGVQSLVEQLGGRSRLASGLVVLASFVFAGFALLMIQAGVASSRAERYLAHWQELTNAPPDAEWHEAVDQAQLAVGRFPVGNAEYLDRLGRIYATVPDSAVDDRARQQSNLLLAEQAFQDSLEIRPSWPWTWLRLAYVKLQQGELNADFSHALQRAVEFGAGHESIDREVAELGFTAWSRLDVTTRAVTLKAAGRAIGHDVEDARHLYSIAQGVGLATPLCWSLQASVKTQQQICKESRQ